MRTYYRGEMLKRKDADAALLQSSSDDYDAMFTYLDTGLNDLCGYLLKKVKELDWSVDGEEKTISISFTPYDRVPPHADQVCRLLKKSVFDYLANQCVYEWMLTVQPDLADTWEERRPELLSAVLKHVGMLSTHLRRRATDLAGI